MANPFDPLGTLTDGHSPGYWGRSSQYGLGVHQRVVAEFIPDKVLTHNYDKMFTLGLAFALYQQAPDIYNGLLTCSCVKDTSSQADIPCLSCYGVGQIPGYVKYGTTGYWAASVTPGWTLTNIVIDTNNRPNRFMLAPGQLSGTATSATIPITVINKVGLWDAHADAFTRDPNGANSTILVQASVDGGVTWFALNLLDSMNPTTTLNFKVIITRTSAAIKSPMFEIVRARYPYLTDIRAEVNEPVIRIVPTWDHFKNERTQIGTRQEFTDKRFWAMPLNFYLNSSARDTSQQRMLNRCVLESRFGALITERFVLTDVAYSDLFGTMTMQSFILRSPTQIPGNRVSGEVTNLIW